MEHDTPQERKHVGVPACWLGREVARRCATTHTSRFHFGDLAWPARSPDSGLPRQTSFLGYPKSRVWVQVGKLLRGHSETGSATTPALSARTRRTAAHSACRVTVQEYCPVFSGSVQGDSRKDLKALQHPLALSLNFTLLVLFTVLSTSSAGVPPCLQLHRPSTSCAYRPSAAPATGRYTRIAGQPIKSSCQPPAGQVGYISYSNWQPTFKMSKIDSDGFQIVKSKHSYKNKATKLPQKQLNFMKQELNVDVERVTRQIKSVFEDLQHSSYHIEVTKLVSKTLNGLYVKEIVCFGLGQISVCNISRHQLAFLLCLKDFCKPQRVLVHDPIFSKGECEILRHFDLDLIEQNNEGSYIISDEGITLSYFPHCPKQLTNNFLWSNWYPSLQNCIIIGNSFNSLIENNPSRLLLETVPYIYKIHPYTHESVLVNNFKYTDIFNDTSLHSFPKEKLDLVSKDFWNKGSKPLYEDTEEFITSLMVAKLNI
ncbi:unnamed protein product [Chilo suppressalis]|uniref:SRR1-like domain-containing protein n=1 Tax=Chilo suppressalis TaxID=168631 RepID=A0ABN8B1M4_CHISP|nr:unnamed protein product [Chilo suppressalis]